MDILFINANLYGHINPTLGVVKELTKRGNHVSYYCSEPFKNSVVEMGAEWIGYSNGVEQFLKEYRPTDRHPFYMLMEYMLLYNEAVLPELISLIEDNHYDMIMTDSYFGAICFLKKMVDIPVISSYSSFAMSHTPVPDRMLVPGFHPQLDHCYSIIERICEKYQIEKMSLEEVFVGKGDLNLVYTIRSFNGDDKIDGDDYLFNGPSLDRKEETIDVDFSAIKEKKLIYISLGSINTDFMDFYKLCISAFRDTEYEVMMSIGKKCDIADLGEIPSNIYVKNFLPQLEILKHADVFISHAGFNSISEALYFGVPVLALPMVNDQRMVASHLASMQLGVVEDVSALSEEVLKERVKTLILDKYIKENCQRISEEMHQSTRIDKSVEKIEQFVREWKGR